MPSPLQKKQNKVRIHGMPGPSSRKLDMVICICLDDAWCAGREVYSVEPLRSEPIHTILRGRRGFDLLPHGTQAGLGESAREIPSASA